eukprot:TRINITY_DN3875_c0_g1_i1.p1 TRINITY_DN3875_c0_g1~~TRINITY_DN3875_c0_g1_i1.p1  ORF type:complete len:496 (+),score=90.58 TRINITY_DN3875_c0_g1_i1:78-1490(+)
MPPTRTPTTISVVQSSEGGDRFALKPSLQFILDSDLPFPTNQTLAVNTSNTYQAILGFGGAFTEAASYTYHTMGQAAQEELIEAYFGQNGLGYSLGRVHMGSCDFCLETYSEANSKDDWNLVNFTIARDKLYIIPMVRAAMAKSSIPLNLYLTPWSPPGWMKSNGQMNTSLKPGLIQSTQVFQAWALHFSKFISAYKNEGISFWGLTVQNEPEAAQQFESCVYNPEQERDFLKNFLGPRIKQDHPDIKIMIYDHNKDHIVTWVSTILSDPVAAPFVSGVAFHWYSGFQFENLAAAHALAPDRFFLATEACNCPVSLGTWTNGERYGTDIMGDLNNWAVGWVDWNMILNPLGQPNHLNQSCDAPILADAKTQKITYNPAYYYMGHFSKFLPRGSVRINSLCPTQLTCTAFRTPKDQIIVIVQNINDVAVTFKLQHASTTSSSSPSSPSPSIYAAKAIVDPHAIISFAYQDF